MKKRNLTFENLLEMVYVVNMYNGHLSDITWGYNDNEEIDLFGEPKRFLRLIQNNHYDVNDEFLFFDNDGYSGVESINRNELEEIYREREDEIVEEYVELVRNGDIIRNTDIKLEYV